MDKHLKNIPNDILEKINKIKKRLLEISEVLEGSFAEAGYKTVEEGAIEVHGFDPTKTDDLDANDADISSLFDYFFGAAIPPDKTHHFLTIMRDLTNFPNRLSLNTLKANSTRSILSQKNVLIAERYNPFKATSISQMKRFFESTSRDYKKKADDYSKGFEKYYTGGPEDGVWVDADSKKADAHLRIAIIIDSLKNYLFDDCNLALLTKLVQDAVPFYEISKDPTDDVHSSVFFQTVLNRGRYPSEQENIGVKNQESEFLGRKIHSVIDRTMRRAFKESHFQWSLVDNSRKSKLISPEETLSAPINFVIRGRTDNVSSTVQERANKLIKNLKSISNNNVSVTFAYNKSKEEPDSFTVIIAATDYSSLFDFMNKTGILSPRRNIETLKRMKNKEFRRAIQAEEGLGLITADHPDSHSISWREQETTKKSNSQNSTNQKK
jgi:hypothetical protein